MIRFENVEIYNWYNAIRGMRNSWESWDKIDSVNEDGRFVMGANDFELMLRLVKAGSDHSKFMRQIMVSVDVIAPEYWWKEADTYKVGTVANSTSMMHLLGKHEITKDMFSFENVPNEHVESYLYLINRLRDEWINSGKKKPSSEWRAMNQLMAIGFNYRRTFTCNYAVLRAMYHSRKSHRLSEWQDFAKWCESLPYSDLITINTNK